MVEVREVPFYDLLVRVEPYTIRHDGSRSPTPEQIQAKKENRLPSYWKTWEQLSKPLPFYLTGDTTLFKLRIKNRQDKKRRGGVAFIIESTKKNNNYHYFDFEVDPLGSWETVFNTIHHTTEGFYEISIIDKGPPERWAEVYAKGVQYVTEEDEALPRIPVTTFTVKDRGVYEEEERRHKELMERVVKKEAETLRTHVIYVDGGFRREGGGHIAWLNETTGQVFHQASDCKDSFRCEYEAILHLLRNAKGLGLDDEIQIRSDNETVVRQLNHDYAINDPDIRQYAMDVWAFNGRFHRHIDFVWIPRQENKAGKLLGS